MIDGIILDTDVVSYLFKRSHHAQRFRDVLLGRQLAISFITVAELYKWTIRRNWSESNKLRLQSALRIYTVIPYDAELAWTWASVSAACERAGKAMAASDTWIAATAIRHGIPLVTNNVAHFEPAESLCSLRLIRVN